MDAKSLFIEHKQFEQTFENSLVMAPVPSFIKGDNVSRCKVFIDAPEK